MTRKAWAGLGALLALAGCAPDPAQAPNGAGDLRIVSLNPCVDALLAEIAPDKLVAVTHWSHDPSASSMLAERARQWPTTGGTVEEIVALQPDLVIASSFLPPATRQALARLQIPVETAQAASTIEQDLAEVRRIADLVGESAAGERLVARIEAAIDRAALETDAGPQTILWQSGGIVAGEGALIVDLMRRLGLQPADATAGLGQGDYLPLERVLAKPPELIMTPGARGTEKARAFHHPAIRALDETQRAAFEPNHYFCGGPSLIRAAERLAAIRDRSG